MKNVIRCVDENGGESIAALVGQHGLSYEDIRACIDAGLIQDCMRKAPYTCMHVTYDGDMFLERKADGENKTAS